VSTAANGEVEGPRDHARWRPRAHTVLQPPRRPTTHASRPPPTIVRPPTCARPNKRRSKHAGAAIQCGTDGHSGPASQSLNSTICALHGQYRPPPNVLQFASTYEGVPSQISAAISAKRKFSGSMCHDQGEFQFTASQIRGEFGIRAVEDPAQRARASAIPFALVIEAWNCSPVASNVAYKPPFWGKPLQHEPESSLHDASTAIVMRATKSLPIRLIAIGGLTVKLSGRPGAPDQRRGRTLSSGARGAKPLTPHGPLQRLLGARRTVSDGFDRTLREQLNGCPRVKPVIHLRILKQGSDPGAVAPIGEGGNDRVCCRTSAYVEIQVTVVKVGCGHKVEAGNTDSFNSSLAVQHNGRRLPRAIVDRARGE